MKETRGRLLAERIIGELRPRAARFQERAGRPPAMSALAADDVTSRRYIQLKQERFRTGGLRLRASYLGPDSTTDDAVLLVGTLNGDAAVDCIFLQFPLPAHVAAQTAADAIVPGKDADAASSVRLGQVLAGTDASPPATPAAVVLLLEDELQELSGRTVVLVGTMGLTERCLALLCVARGGTACVLAPADPALADAAAGADAIVITDDLPPGDALRHARNGAVLIDAAYARPPRPPTWLPQRALEHLGTYLPQYGNVGPLTVALLMRSTLEAAAAARP